LEAPIQTQEFRVFTSLIFGSMTVGAALELDKPNSNLKPD
jgi:hypothetical protein